MAKSNIQKIVDQIHKDIRMIEKHGSLGKEDIILLLKEYLKIVEDVKPSLWDSSIRSELLQLISFGEPGSYIRSYSPLLHETKLIPFSEKVEDKDKVKYLYKKGRKCFSIELPKVSDEHKKIIKNFMSGIVLEEGYEEEK